MEEYKGIYYDDETEQKFYEGGAHFKYISLYKVLEKIAKERYQKEKQKELLSIHKNINLSPTKNNNKNKKTRNNINHLDIKKLGLNTISNNLNKKNDINSKVLFTIKNNLMLNQNKSKSKSKSKSKHKYNFSLINNKKDINLRNKFSFKVYKGRPNTLFKDRLQKILIQKNHRLLSSSMERENIKKNKFPINIKRSLPEFPLKSKKFRNYSNNKKNKINNNIKINLNAKSINIIDNNKQNIINTNTNLNNKIKENNNNTNTNNNFNILINNDIKNEYQTNIYDSNLNKTNMKIIEIKPSKEEKNEKKEIYIHTDVKKIKKNPDYFYNKLYYTNSIDISKKTHKIINKRITANRNQKLRIRTKSLITTDINDTTLGFSNKSKDKEKIHLFTNNKSSKKKNIKSNIKKDFNFHNNSLMARTTFNQHFFNFFQESNKKKAKKKFFMNKKLNNNKKMNKNNYLKINNNQLTFNNFVGKSRNYNGNNISLQIKNTFNHNNIANKSRNINTNDKLNKYFKTIIDMNKTYNNDTNKINYLNRSGNKSSNKSNNKNNNSKINYNYINDYKFIDKQTKKKIYNNN